MKASFRHEMGHILRGDCLLTMSFSKVRNSNACMDIRINDQLEREGLEQVYIIITGIKKIRFENHWKTKGFHRTRLRFA